MTSDSHYCESHWYLGLGGNALASPFYTEALHVVINSCRLSGPGLPPYVDMAGTPSLAPCKISKFKEILHRVSCECWELQNIVFYRKCKSRQRRKERM